MILTLAVEARVIETMFRFVLLHLMHHMNVLTPVIVHSFLYRKKGSDRDPIFQFLLDDLKKINNDTNMFYVKSLNKYNNVHCDLIVVNGDSPEFHDAKHLSCGNCS